MIYQDEDFLQLSGLQHFKFCRRQWALIHVEKQWAENYRTTDGAIMHENAHKLFDLVKVEHKDGVTAPRSYGDYTVSVDETHLPSGVTCTRMG